MNNNRKLIFISGIIVIMLVFVWLFSGGSSEQDTRRPYVSDNWNVKFQPFSKDPLGLYLFNTLVQSHIDKSKDLYEVQTTFELDSIMHAGKGQKTFLFVGNIFGLLEGEMDSILSSINKGSDLFLSYNDVMSNTMPNFFVKYNQRYEYSSSVNVFTDKLKCEMLNIYQQDTVACEWNAFGDIETKEPSKVLSSFMEMDNFIEIKLGEGKVFLHTNPAMFYNYQIKRRSGFKYTDFAISQIPKNQDVLLLELGRRSDEYGQHSAGNEDGEGGQKDSSFLRIIIESPTLLSALLVSILGLILFAIFRSKRIRPIIPYRGKKKDMTLAFAETITSIYFAKRNPYGLLQVQRKNFYATIHRYFFVDLHRREEDRELVILSEKSNKPLSEIKEIVQKLETKKASSVKEQDVADIAQLLRTFYREVGIIPELVEKRLERKEITFRRSMIFPILLIMTGLFAIFLGVYYLVISNGAGIALWPVGIALFILGVIRLSNPFMKVNPDEIIYYTAFGTKQIFKQKDLIGTKMKESGVVLKFTNDKMLIIKYWDLSRFDRKDFERFVAKLHTLEL